MRRKPCRNTSPYELAVFPSYSRRFHREMRSCALGIPALRSGDINK